MLTIATITSQGRITIPVSVRQALAVDAGDRVEFIQIEPGQFLLVASNRSVIELKGMFGKAAKVVSIEDMSRAAMAPGASTR